MIRIVNGDVREAMRSLPSESVHCVVTSPPYWGLRNYGVEGQIGREETPEAYVSTMVDVFRDVWRILRPDGTLWLNLGDSYAANRSYQVRDGKSRDVFNHQPMTVPMGFKPKDLIGIPWRVAFALQAEGWYLRTDIVWSKPNPMPESVKDRPTRSHEFLFLMSKSPTYFYDAGAIMEPCLNASDDQRRKSRTSVPVESQNDQGRINRIVPKTDKQRGHSRRHAGFNDRWDKMTREEQTTGMRNKRSVWRVATRPFCGAHFATFPPELIRPCILAGCPEGGTVLDPFGGAGTTGLVAEGTGRNSILVELNPSYVSLMASRLKKHFGMMLDLSVSSSIPATEGGGLHEKIG